MAAGNTFILFEGATGESRQKNFDKGHIEIDGFKWEVTSETSFTKGQGASVGKAVPGIASFSHYYDTASPTMMAFCVKGKHFPKVTATMCKSTGDANPKPFFIVEMESCYITKATVEASEDGSVKQDIEFVFKTIEIKYHKQDDKGQLDAGAKTFKWNIPQMEATSG
ncbi:MAG: Hcp family type VI secretion system effector [Betaproteobacteria bacterium]